MRSLCLIRHGASADHRVLSADLDEGPIIGRDGERVSHNESADELAEIGREVESRVLDRAVRWHAERRVLLHGRRTVVVR
jgi:formyltetrahydrofolate deformylase